MSSTLRRPNKNGLLAELDGCTMAASFLLLGPRNSLSCVVFRKEKTMNFRALPAWKPTSLTSVANSIRHDSAARRLPLPMSRRQFARTAAGSAFAAAVGSRLWTTNLAEAASFAPVPIPGGSPALGGAYHVFGPAAFDPIDAEPVTITNLNAAVGLAYVSGMVTQTNIKTGEVVRLPFVDSDMRFMHGVFRGTDGRVHRGAFAFV